MSGPLDDVLDACVRCGFCLPACPTYDVLRGELDSPRGRIALARGLESGRLAGSEVARRHLDRCLGCRACEAACPSGVRYGAILSGARERLTTDEGARKPPFPARVLLRAFRSSAGITWIMRALRLARATGLLGAGRRLGGALGAAARAAPATTWRAHSRSAGGPHRPQGPPRARVALLTGCVMDHGFAGVQAAAVRLLTTCGYEVHVPRGPRCCGALHEHAGRTAEARQMADELASAVADTDFVAVTGAGCGSHLKEAPGPLAGRVRDVLELVDVAGLPGSLRPIAPRFGPAGSSLRIAYDAPCHLEHAQGIRDAPLRLLRGIPDVEVVPLAGSDRCCGGAGLYSLTQPELSATLLAEKVAAIRASGADLVVTANPGCQLQIAAGLRSAGLGLRVEHVLTLLDAALA